MNRVLLALLALFVAAPMMAQDAATIRPGMSARAVVAVFGQPTVARDAGDWTYLFYRNGCPVRCGSDDVVFLRDGEVVAAVLRSPKRRFTGSAASELLEDQPPSRGLELTAGASRGAATVPSGRGAVSGIRVETGAVTGPVGRRRVTDLGVFRGPPPVYGAGGQPVDTVDNAITTTPAQTLSPSAAGEPNPLRPGVTIQPNLRIGRTSPVDTVDNAITTTPAQTLSPSAAGAVDTLRRRPSRRP